MPGPQKDRVSPGEVWYFPTCSLVSEEAKELEAQSPVVTITPKWQKRHGKVSILGLVDTFKCLEVLDGAGSGALRRGDGSPPHLYLAVSEQ